LLITIEDRRTKKILNRKGAKDAKGSFGWFVVILEEGPRITTHQALTGGIGLMIEDCRLVIERQRKY